MCSTSVGHTRYREWCMQRLNDELHCNGGQKTTLQWKAEHCNSRRKHCNNRRRRIQRYIAIFDGGRTTVNSAPPRYGRYCKCCNKVPCTLFNIDIVHHLVLFEHCSNACPNAWHVFKHVQTLQVAMHAVWRAVQTLFKQCQTVPNCLNTV